MAGINSTATTPEELAEQFPCTVRPFAVWYSLDQVNGRGCWAVNNESGEPTQEFEDMATALKVASELGQEWEAEARKQAQALAEVAVAKSRCVMLDSNKAQPTPEQMKIAFEQIATMANALQGVCNNIIAGTNSGALAMGAQSMAVQIGWIADRCIGFDVKEPDAWMLPPNWERTESEAAHA